MSNVGKDFELDFKQSVPDCDLIYRIPDPAQIFGGGTNLRFSAKSPFDFILWDAKRHRLLALELKTVKGYSISFERSTKDSGEIHVWQLDHLNRWSQYDGIVAGLVIEFRVIEKAIFLDIRDMNTILDVIPKKSFNFDDLQKYRIPYIEIGRELKRSRYRYDVATLLTKINAKENKRSTGEQS